MSTDCKLNLCKDKGCQNYGGSTRLIYDACAYRKTLQESTSPLGYMLYEGKHENCDKCRQDKFWRPFDREMVDVESDLKNITRPNTKCPQFKYNPACKKSGSCFSTFDNSAPIILAPEVCPIVHNNIPKMTTPGYSVPSSNICNK